MRYLKDSLHDIFLHTLCALSSAYEQLHMYMHMYRATLVLDNLERVILKFQLVATDCSILFAAYRLVGCRSVSRSVEFAVACK